MKTPLYCPYFSHFATSRWEHGNSWYRAHVPGAAGPCHPSAGPNAKGSGDPSPAPISSSLLQQSLLLLYIVPTIPAPSICRRGGWGPVFTQPQMKRAHCLVSVRGTGQACPWRSRMITTLLWEGLLLWKERVWAGVRKAGWLLLPGHESRD